MRRTAALLGGGVACLLGAALLGRFVGFDAGMVLSVLGLGLVVAAIASSYLSDVREGYRSARER